MRLCTAFYHVRQFQLDAEKLSLPESVSGFVQLSVLAFSPIPGVYDFYIVHFLSHPCETFRNLIRIHHD